MKTRQNQKFMQKIKEFILLTTMTSCICFVVAYSFAWVEVEVVTTFLHIGHIMEALDEMAAFVRVRKQDPVVTIRT